MVYVEKWCTPVFTGVVSAKAFSYVQKSVRILEVFCVMRKVKIGSYSIFMEYLNKD